MSYPVLDALTKIMSDKYLLALAKAESSFNPLAENPTSSAKGLFQFISSVRNSLNIVDWRDIVQQYQGIVKFTETHKALLKTDDPYELYSAHYLGLPVYKKHKAGERLTETQKAQVHYLKTKALPRFRRIYDEQT